MKYNLDLTQEEIQLICNALGELPLKTVGNIFDKIRQQVSEQEQATQQDSNTDLE